MEDDLENVEKARRKHHEPPPEVDSETRNLVHQSNLGNTSAYDLMTTVIKEAETLRKDRESNYRIGARVSYFLFVIGWALTFYGRAIRKTGRRHSRLGLTSVTVGEGCETDDPLANRSRFPVAVSRFRRQCFSGSRAGNWRTHGRSAAGRPERRKESGSGRSRQAGWRKRRKARAEKLSNKRQSEIAKKAAKVRWSKQQRDEP